MVAQTQVAAKMVRIGQILLEGESMGFSIGWDMRFESKKELMDV